LATNNFLVTRQQKHAQNTHLLLRVTRCNQLRSPYVKWHAQWRQNAQMMYEPTGWAKKVSPYWSINKSF